MHSCVYMCMCSCVRARVCESDVQWYMKMMDECAVALDGSSKLI